MKMHSTNYYNTFIEVAEDCSALSGATPPARAGNPSVAALQYDQLKSHPYHFTSDEILFLVFALRKEIPRPEWEAEKKRFFSTGQACLRASPLSKSYGWGIHFDKDGKIALYGRESAEYQQFMDDASIKKLKAMRSKRT